jgi:membrane protein implicated in regulation of membrane protease activity
MTWSDFYLLCFLVGFALSVLSFLAGAVHLHLPFKIHLPFHWGHHAGGGGGGLKGGMHISWFNAMTIMVFLAWFGGIGYLVTNHSHIVAFACLGIAVFGGLLGGFLVFRFMAKLVKASDGQMFDWDYRLEGSVGTLSMPIREGGIGEIIFEQNGARRSMSARSEDGQPLPKGAEVVISRFEDGIAYVKRWEDFTN